MVGGGETTESESLQVMTDSRFQPLAKAKGLKLLHGLAECGWAKRMDGSMIGVQESFQRMIRSSLRSTSKSSRPSRCPTQEPVLPAYGTVLSPTTPSLVCPSSLMNGWFLVWDNGKTTLASATRAETKVCSPII